MSLDSWIESKWLKNRRVEVPFGNLLRQISKWLHIGTWTLRYPQEIVYFDLDTCICPSCLSNLNKCFLCKEKHMDYKLSSWDWVLEPTTRWHILSYTFACLQVCHRLRADASPRLGKHNGYELLNKIAYLTVDKYLRNNPYLSVDASLEFFIGFAEHDLLNVYSFN